MNFLDLLQRASLFGLAALAVALLLQWALTSRVPAHWRVWIWRVALIQTTLALIPFAPIALAVLPARAPSAASEPIVAPATRAPKMEPTVDDAPAPAVAPYSEIAPATVTVTPPAIAEAPIARNVPPSRPIYGFDFRLSWRMLALWVYGFGIALQLALLARNIFRVRRALRACAPLDNAVLRLLAERLKIRQLPLLRQSASGSPFLIGILRPTIVVPQTLNRAHLEAVFAHELAHLRRKDLAWNALLWLLQTLLWFHPLSWISRRFHALEVESACDELTLQLTSIAPKSYGALLIGAENPQTSPLTAGVNDGFFALQTRLRRLSRAPIQPRRRAAWLLGAALLVSFAAIVPVKLVARAQNTTEKATVKMRTFSGIVRDYQSKPVAGAKVTALSVRDNDTILPSTVTDSAGRFVLRDVKNEGETANVFVDAGARGFGNRYLRRKFENIEIQVAQPVSLTLRLLDSNGKPVPKMGVRLWNIGSRVDSPLNLPAGFRNQFRGTTDARGMVTFNALPRGSVALFSLVLKAGAQLQYAQLNAVDNTIALPGAKNYAQVQLTKGTILTGRVTLPSGKAAAQFNVVTRRISAAEARGETGMAAVDYTQLSGVTDAQGNYRVENLLPGNYYVWVGTSPKATGVVGFSKQLSIAGATQRLDFALPRGGLIQGVVVSQQTGQPVKGQTMGLRDSQDNYDYAITDARGYFRFRTLAGAQHLWIHANGSNSPPPGYALPAKSEFDFPLEDGEKREFKFALPEKIAIAPIGGVVRNADGAAAANATVVYRSLGGRSGGFRFAEVKADAQGRFALPAKVSESAPVQLFADLGEQTTPQSVVALSGDEVQLRLAPNSWASLNGQVVDDNKKPLAGAKVTLHTLIGHMGLGPRETTSDAQGRYRFEHLRPGTGAMLRATKNGYSQSYDTSETLNAGQQLTMNSAIKRAPKTLSGTVFTEDGNPASGYQISADGQNTWSRTRKDGKFYLSQVFAGPITVQVSAPQGGRSWREFRATGGDNNLVLRLSKAGRDDRFESRPSQKESKVSLVGKIAPAIQATRWGNNKAVSLDTLKGQTVLLLFDNFGRGSGDEQRALARALDGRARVVGIQLSTNIKQRQWNPDADDLAKQLGFPVAVDAVSPTAKFSGWQTYDSYGGARYAVIARDGKVVYAGRNLERAIELVTAQ